MHELSILGEVVRIVEQSMAANNLKKVKTIVLQVGELSGVVPRFLEECYAAASYKTPLDGSTLDIEIIPALARCHACGKVFNIVENNSRCQSCRNEGFDILTGRDFFIKHIVAI